MNAITVWLLVGVVSFGGNTASAPNNAMFPTVQACEVVKRATEEAASYSKLRCVQTQVVITK